MKVRIGISLGGADPIERLDDVLAQLEALKVDSLWLSELVSAPGPDPIVGLAYAAAKTHRLKLGTGVSVLPGRNPVLFAKQIATLARLAPGRILPAVGLGPALPADRDVFQVPRGRRGDVLDEALTVVRRLLTEPSVTFHGEFYTLNGVGIGEHPTKPLDIWIGGSAPAALRRVGRLGDGWLASLITPAEAEAGIGTINAAAEAAGRAVDQEHFGLSLPVVLGDEVPDGILAGILRRRPDVDPADLIPVGWDGLLARIADYVAAGVSKFVIRPASPPPSWADFVDAFAAEIHPIET